MVWTQTVQLFVHAAPIPALDPRALGILAIAIALAFAAAFVMSRL